MIRGLIEKELRQHIQALLFLLLLVVGGVFFISQNKLVIHSDGTPFGSLRWLLLSFFALACLVLAQSLIVSEYRHKTQLFLEGLPLPRWRMMAVKYGMGLSFMFSALAVVFAIAWHKSLGSDACTPRFLMLLGLRSACYVWFLWSLCFAHGFMGRYRILFGLLAFMAIVAPITLWGIDFSRFGPFELIGTRFAYERFQFPGIPFAVTACDALFWTATGFLLGLARDTTISTALSQRMSSREKIVLTFVVFAAFMGVASYKSQHATSEPILFPGAVEATRGIVHVSATAAVDAPTDEESAALDQVVVRVADELAAVAHFLRCETMPPVWIVHRRDVTPNHLDFNIMTPEEGVIVRVNLTSKELDRADFLQRIIFHALLTKSFTRLELEQNAWVLEGFSDWWLTRGAPLGEDSKELRAAIKTAPSDFSKQHIDRWLMMPKNDADRGALAATGLRVLNSRHGEKACREFLGSVLGVEVKKDSRACLRDLFNPVSHRFRLMTGTSLECFVTEWRDALRETSSKLPKEVQP